MRIFFLLMAVTALFCTSCGSYCRDPSLYKHSGKQKAIVAVLPVLDHSGSHDLNWELSREFTDEIRNRVYNSQKVYLLREGGSPEIARLLSTPNPAAIPSRVAESLGAAEFVIVSEILSQKQTPCKKHSALECSNSPELGAVLSVEMRVRVVDVRSSTPKVVLQEILNQELNIPQLFLGSDYQKAHWGTEAFRNTPMGVAHSRLIQSLVARTEAYIDAAR